MDKVSTFNVALESNDVLRGWNLVLWRFSRLVAVRPSGIANDLAGAIVKGDACVHQTAPERHAYLPNHSACVDLQRPFMVIFSVFYFEEG